MVIAIFMVFLLSLTTSESFAYFYEVSDASNVTSATVSMGESWPQIFPFDPDAPFAIGDLVLHNGVLYEASKDNPTKEPGIDSGWQSEWKD